MASGRVPKTKRILCAIHHRLHDLVEVRGYRRPPVVFFDKLAGGAAQLCAALRIAQKLHYLAGEVAGIVCQDDVLALAHGEIKLHKPETVLESLARRGHKGDGAGLGGHDRQPNRGPPDRLVALHVGVQVVATPCAQYAVRGDSQHAPQQHREVQQVHWKTSVRTSKSNTHTTKQPSTNAYTTS